MYRKDIDGLRAFAVLAVVFYHAFPDYLPGGFIGVDVFFVISGFLITRNIFISLDQEKFSFLNFYSSRIVRIFPALIIVVSSCMLFGYFSLTGDELSQLLKHISAGAGFISNFILWSESGYFDNQSITKPLLHLWSLGIEEQFYIVLPLVLYFGHKERLNPMIFFVTLTFTSLYLNMILIKEDTVAAFYSPYTRFYELMFGSIIAYVTLYKRIFSIKHSVLKNKFIQYNFREIYYKNIINLVAYLGSILLVCGAFELNNTYKYPGIWALIPVCGATLIILAGPNALINRIFLSNRIAVRIGLISYPLYLWHWPLLSFAHILNNGENTILIRITLVFLSFWLASITYNFIECPIRFAKNKQFMAVSLSIFMIMIGSVSFYLYYSEHFKLKNLEEIAISRSEFKNAFGPSLNYIKGHNDWLFLGNAYNNTISKLKLDIIPDEKTLKERKEFYLHFAETGQKYGTKLILFIGPNKDSIYPEYLPENLIPASKKYIDIHTDNLKDVPNLSIYNPSRDLLRQKQNGRLLYSRVDTHWNNFGAYIAYVGFSQRYGFPVPQVNFIEYPNHISGDLISITKLKNFPIHSGNDFDVSFIGNSNWIESKTSEYEKNIFKWNDGSTSLNKNPLSDYKIWVVGDSFTSALKKYLNATFKEVRYVAHIGALDSVPDVLINAKNKPDLILVVKVERDF